MDITEFLQQSAGKWFSQRTNHHLAFRQMGGGKSDLYIEWLSKDDPVVVKLCQQYNVDPASALCGVRVEWSGTVEWDQNKQTGSTVLVPLADPENPNEGQLLRAADPSETPSVAGRYVMGSDDALTLITERENLYSEERLWFASPNLRLRTSVLKHPDGFSVASFCSEIRMGGVQAAAQQKTNSVSVGRE
jgi:hypothetical protein